MKKNIKVCLIFFTMILVILMINFSIILNKTGIIKKEKQIQKEMSSSNKETELNTQLTDANKSATEYANYVQTCKTLLASTISDEGIETSENDTFEKMVTNIGDIFTERTKLDESVAATADNISEGKQAYVNGELITGTGADNNFYFEQGSNLKSKIYIPSIVFNHSSTSDAWTANVWITLDTSGYSSLSVNSVTAINTTSINNTFRIYNGSTYLYNSTRPSSKITVDVSSYDTITLFAASYGVTTQVTINGITLE